MTDRYGNWDPVGDYLRDLWDNPRTKYQLQGIIGGLPYVGEFATSYWQTQDNLRYWDDYLRNRGMSWSDIRYPSRSVGYGSYVGATRASLNFVSHNVSRLYK